MRKQQILSTITNLIERSNFGDLSAEFILDAIQKHANNISRMDPNDFTNPLIGGRKWWSVAKEIQSKLQRSV